MNWKLKLNELWGSTNQTVRPWSTCLDHELWNICQSLLQVNNFLLNTPNVAPFELHRHPDIHLIGFISLRSPVNLISPLSPRGLPGTWAAVLSSHLDIRIIRFISLRCSDLRSQHSYFLKLQCSSNQPMHSSRLLIFDCPLRQHGCSKRFRSQAGCTHHIWTIHTISNIVTQPQTLHSPGYEPISPPPLIVNDNNQPSPPPLDLNADISQSPSLAECSSPFPGQPNQRYHPWLTGEQIFNSLSSGFYWAYTFQHWQEGLVMKMVNFYLMEYHPLPNLTQAWTTGNHLKMRSNS